VAEIDRLDLWLLGLPDHPPRSSEPIFDEEISKDVAASPKRLLFDRLVPVIAEERKVAADRSEKLILLT
jgi:hypothetical protein